MSIDPLSKSCDDAGPPDAQATWASDGDAQTITFGDGNVWELLRTPTPAVTADDGLNDHAGVFIDPGHYVGAGEWTGLRIIAEFPAHVLKMVGADVADPTRFWYLEGKCTGDDMSSIHFDFSPKGGPADLTGTWAWDGSRTITWPDGNAWRKPGGAERVTLSSPRSLSPLSGAGGVLLVVAVLAAVGLLAVRLRRSFFGAPRRADRLPDL